MRLYFITLFAGIAAAGGASASSFETPPSREGTGSPSFVYLGGEPKAASFTAMGEPAVEHFKVAAVEPEKPARPLFSDMPLVMRGGVWGDAFASAPKAAPQETASASPAPSQAAMPESEPVATSDQAGEQTNTPSQPPRGIMPVKGMQ